MESNRKDENKHIVRLEIPYELTEEEKNKISEFGGCIEETPSLWQRLKDKLGI